MYLGYGITIALKRIAYESKEVIIMAKRKLLFVTYRDDNLEEGVSYAIELAKAMYEDITLLLVQKKTKLINKLENLMTAVSFAEANDKESVHEITGAGSELAERRYEKILAELMRKCSEEGIAISIQETDLDVISGIRTFLKNYAGIDKVVLSPTVTGNGSVSPKELNRLVRSASRPIVTMTKQVWDTAC